MAQAIIECANSKSNLQHNIGHIIFTYVFIPSEHNTKSFFQDHQPLSDVAPVMSTSKLDSDSL